MQVFTYICAILFLHLSNQEGFSVPSITLEIFYYTYDRLPYQPFYSYLCRVKILQVYEYQ